MSRFRDISDSDANEFRPLLPEELDCVLTAENFSRFKFDRETCQVFTDCSTFTIVVRGRLAEHGRPFEARLFRDKTITFEMRQP